jgi:hypothetical protein
MGRKKICEQCGTEYAQREVESNATFKNRRFCGRACGAKYGHTVTAAKRVVVPAAPPFEHKIGDPGRSLSRAEILKLMLLGAITPISKVPCTSKAITLLLDTTGQLRGYNGSRG